MKKEVWLLWRTEHNVSPVETSLLDVFSKEEKGLKRLDRIQAELTRQAKPGRDHIAILSTADGHAHHLRYLAGSWTLQRKDVK